MYHRKKRSSRKNAMGRINTPSEKPGITTSGIRGFASYETGRYIVMLINGSGNEGSKGSDCYSSRP
jgi:hypothetical protein